MRQHHQSITAPYREEDAFFICTLSGQSGPAVEFQKLTPFLKNQAKKRAPEFPDDLIDEIVCEMWLIALTRGGGAFDPCRGSARTYLCCTIRDAARSVRAKYNLPGQPTRPRFCTNDGTDTDPAFSYQHLSLDDEQVQDQIRFDEKHIENQVDASRILNRLEGPLREYLERVYLYGETGKEVCDDLGISRFKIHRQMVNLKNHFKKELTIAIETPGSA